MNVLRFFTRLTIATAAWAVLAICARAQTVTTDLADYAPGATAYITGSGFAANTAVTLLVTHTDGTPVGGGGHETWVVTSDGDGNFSTTWYVDPDDSAGSSLRLSADAGDVHAEVLFTDSHIGLGRVSSVTASDGGCASGPNGNNQAWDLQQGKTYVVRLTHVTDAVSGDAATMPVLVKSSENGNTCVTATRISTGTYDFTFTLPMSACNTMPIQYGTCDTNSRAGGAIARGPNGSDRASHLRAATYAAGCTSPATDTDCIAPPPPVVCSITAPASVTANTDSGSCYATITDLGSPTVGSNCSTATASGVPENDRYLPGDTTITWSTTCGSMTCTATQIVTVSDDELPVITACAAPVTVQCAAGVPDADVSLVTATDNCGSVTVEHMGDSTTSLGCPNHFTVTRTYRVTDSNDNIASCTQTITVDDTVGPLLANVPASTGYQCRQAVPSPPTVTASDNCDEGIAVSYSQTETNPGSSCSNTITRTWSASDSCGHTTTATQTITVNDTTAPVLAGVPANAAFQCYASVPGPAPVTASDNCDANVAVTLTETESNPGSNCNNVITRTWSTTDACGLTTSATQTINVSDTTNPTVRIDLGVPSTIQLRVGSTCPATLLYSVVKNDNCGDEPIFAANSPSPASGSTLACGTTSVTAAVNDACGNSATDSKPVTVLTSVRAVKFYDRNTNGVQDSGEPPVPGFRITLNSTIGHTDSGGNFDFLGLSPETFTVSETSPNSNWLPTTATSTTVTLGCCPQQVSFGNVCRGPGGGLTKGFWGNKNGQAIINADSGVYTFLSGLNLRKADGSNYDPATYSSLQGWLASANATNMAYMLSAQLTAMELNVRNNKVNGSALIYAPGTNSANAAGFATVNAVKSEANTELGVNGNSPSGGTCGCRAYQEALKNALDNANNNLTFVQGLPCNFVTPY